MIYRILIAGGALAVDAQKYGEQDGEAPERWASVAEERQGDSDNGCDAQHHSYINK